MCIELLTVEEAASFLRLRPQTLARWRVEGSGPAFVRVGGRVLYERAELERFVSAGRRRSTTDGARGWSACDGGPESPPPAASDPRGPASSSVRSKVASANVPDPLDDRA